MELIVKESKSEIYAKNLTENIRNKTLKRKCLPNQSSKCDDPKEDLALYRYKRYLGSLRCMLDTQKMRKFNCNEY